MPSRAFLLFGLDGAGLVPATQSSQFQCPRGHFCFSDQDYEQSVGQQDVSFQCPRGHFCFSDRDDAGRVVGAIGLSFNALAGIFAFRTCWRGCPSASSGRAFQCPRGHFCFSDAPCTALTARANCGFNALAGIFAFRTGEMRRFHHGKLPQFQCPHGHFCFSDLCRHRGARPRAVVSMPSRAFLLFGRGFRI